MSSDGHYIALDTIPKSLIQPLDPAKTYTEADLTKCGLSCFKTLPNPDARRKWRLAELVVTPQRMEKGDVTNEASEDRGGRSVKAYNHPIDFYFRSNILSAQQRHAGKRFGEVWFDGCARSRHAQWKYQGFTGGTLDPDMLHHTSEEFRDTINAVRGMKERQITFSVCCIGEFAGRGRMDYLRSGLDDLSAYFKSLHSQR